jgi:putative endonuclease
LNETARMRLGRLAEDWAAQTLSKSGAEIVVRTFRRRSGELDLVAIDGELLLIVEVRLRSSSDYGGADGSIDAGKRRRIVRTTQQLLQIHRTLARLRVRFDVMVVEQCDDGVALGDAPGRWRLRWLRHAFDATT